MRAWTGKGMALPLSRKLGLSKTWQLMQALGEMPNAGIQTVDAAPQAGMSRGAFLKGVGGAAVALSALSATGPLVSVAQAARKPHPHDVVEVVPIKKEKLVSLSRRIALNADMKAISGSRLDTNKKISASNPIAVKQKLRNGTYVTVITFFSSTKRILTHATFSQPVGRGALSLAKVLVKDSSNNFTIVKVSEGGRLWRRPVSTSRSIATTRSSPLGECPPETGSNDGSSCAVYYTYECLSWKDYAGCFAGYGIYASATCVGCVASFFSAARGREDSKSAQVGCSMCLDGLDPNNLKGCSECRYAERVKRYDYSRC